MENSFSVHHQTYNNKKAVDYTISEFRKYFPIEEYRLISDNGEDFSDLEEKFNINFVFKNKNTFPGGRFQNIQNCYDWLERVNETCELYNTEWVVIFEDDVLTQNNDIQFPTEDSAGMSPHQWSPGLTTLLKTKNTKNKNWGYGMCGGSIFRRESFLQSYKKIDEFDLEIISRLDKRIIGYSDTLINSFLQYFGYSYQKWDCLDDMSLPGHEYSKKSCFIHGNKLYY